MLKLASLTLLASAGLCAATINYDVAVNTSSLSGTGGLAYFQFNPGDATSDAATAVISNFQITSPGALSGPTGVSGGGSGSLGTAVTIENSAANNDALQALSFGSALSFRLSITDTVSGSALTGSVFNFGLYQADGITPVLTNQPDGYSIIVNLSAAGVPSATSTTGAATITLAGSTVPEPATSALFALGLIAGGVVYRRQRRVSSV